MIVLLRAVVGSTIASVVGWVSVSALLVVAAVLVEGNVDSGTLNGVVAVMFFAGVIGVPIAWGSGVLAWLILDRGAGLSPAGGTTAGLCVGALFLVFYPLGLAALVAGPLAGYAAVRLTNRWLPRSGAAPT
ncbi:MAG: hypothetical protein AAF318_11675 [Pseudomonadota bacterium]